MKRTNLIEAMIVTAAILAAWGVFGACLGVAVALATKACA